MIQKTSIPINFAKGLDQKTDPKQVEAGNFLSLVNSVFSKGGLLQKRNGLPVLAASAAGAQYLTTLSSNLVAVGDTVDTFSAATNSFVTGAPYIAAAPSVVPIVRNGVNQTQCDAALASNGLVCTVYTENNGSAVYRYVISSVATGQNVQPPTLIPAASSGAVTGSARVFVVGVYFIIVLTNVISGTSHLQYIAIPTGSPTTAPTAAVDISSAYAATSTLSWDGVVASNGNLYVAWDTTTGGQAIKAAYLSPTLTLSAATTISNDKATIMSLCCDSTNPSVPIIWASFYNGSTSTGYVVAVDRFLNSVLTSTQTITSGNGVAVNMTAVAQNGVCTGFFEGNTSYIYDSGIPTHFVGTFSVTQGGTLRGPGFSVLSVGLASKAFLLDGIAYYLAAYQSPYQPSYFLINGTTSTNLAPMVIAKLAYENGGGYLTLGLPSISVSGMTARVPYLIKDFITSQTVINNTQQTATPPVYAQTGVNLAAFNFESPIAAAEAGGSLGLGGGFGWTFDGTSLVENGFFLWPDSVEGTPDTGSGSVSPQQYYYQFCYEWQDNAGNLIRSAPSIPISVTTADSSSANTLYVPTLRLTYKTAAPVNIVGYRWSTAQQVYHQFTSISAPVQNTLSANYVTIVDTASDASIAGNAIIYTTGGVVEDINPPGYQATTLFDTRQWLIDAEDPNLLWFSKQVIEGTPVEWSDLLTYYIAPNIGTSQTTGPVLGLAPMDDKLIIFKKDSIFYVNGTGPDNTGSNSQYSQPIFITSTVGCSIPQSIVLTQAGLMFQSDKGIWLLGRDLSTVYIGSPVETATLGSVVTSAQNIPATTQIRFTLSSGLQLMYDYFYGQWASFQGAPALSSCIYNGLHTILNPYGQICQESPGAYLDAGGPVLLSFQTGWIALQGISGYQRLYELQFLGQYVTPHRWNLQIGYNFGAESEQALIQPLNYTGVYGSDDLYGQTTPWGGPGSLEQWRIQPSVQKCQSFQLQLQEVFDPTLGVSAGAGFTLSTITATVGILRGYRPVPAAQTAGTS